MIRDARTHPRRPAPRSAALAAAALVLALVPASPRAAVPDFVSRSAWTEAATPHFTVMSDAGQGAATDVARRLERLAQAMARVNPGFRSSVPTAVRVVVLSDVEQVRTYARFAQIENSNGFSAEGPDGDWIVLAATVPGVGSRTELLAHEYIHGYLRANLATLPAWLNEGLAQYYATVRIQGSWAELGRADPDYVAFCRRQETMPLETLFGITAASRAYLRENPLQRAFYAQSWMLTHYLLSESGGRRERFAGWLARLQQGAPARQSFIDVFGATDYGVLHAESRGYLDQIAFEKPRRVEFPEQLEDTPVSERPLPLAEALTRLGALVLAFGPEQHRFAHEHLARAVELDSTHAPARAVWGYVLDLEGDTAGADAAYARAAVHGADAAAPALWAGLGTLQRFLPSSAPVTGATPPLLLAARRHFARALELDPRDPRSLAGYGRTFVLDARVDSTAIRALERALEVQPGRIDVAADLASLKTRAGDRDAAGRLVRDRVASRVGSADARRIESGGDAVTLVHAGALLEQSRYAEAESLFREVAAWSTDEKLRGVAREQAARARARRIDQGFVSLFERGLAESRESRFATAQRWFERARDTTEDRARRIEAGRAIVHTRAAEAMRQSVEALGARRFTAARATLDGALALPLQAEDRARVRALRDEAEARIQIDRAEGLVQAGRLREARAAYLAVAGMNVREEVRAHARQRVADLDKALRGSR